MNLMKLFLIFPIAAPLFGHASLAENKPNTWVYVQGVNQNAAVFLNDDGARKIYELLQSTEYEEVNGLGQKLGTYAKKSPDGALWCRRIPRASTPTDYQCLFIVDGRMGIDPIYK